MTKRIRLSVKGKFAIVDDEWYEHLMQWKWTYVNEKGAKGKGYAKRQIVVGAKTITIPMQNEIMGFKKGRIVDHINLNSLDNQEKNLRWATYSQNLHNMKRRKNNTSGYKGVSYNKGKKRWRARIHIDGVEIVLGLFGNVKDAARAYDRTAKKLMGKFARTNLKS